VLCQRARTYGTVYMHTSKDRITAVMVAGMWQALGQAGVFFQRHRGHVMDRHPDGTAMGEVDQGEEGTDRVAEASVLLQCQPMNGCIWPVPCVHSMRPTERICLTR
jgi:hypothetical protein